MTETTDYTLILIHALTITITLTVTLTMMLLMLEVMETMERRSE